MKKKLFVKGISVIALVLVMTIIGCGNGSTNSTNSTDNNNTDNGHTGIGIIVSGSDMTYSISVNNKAASNNKMVARAIMGTDTVELFINNFEYNYDTFKRGEDYGYNLIIVADGDRTYPGGILNNADWYSVTADLGIVNGGHELGSYSSFAVHISKLRINGKEYIFPVQDPLQPEVCFGDPTLDWWKLKFSEEKVYLGNFNGINITASHTSLETVIIVDPDIIDAGGNLVSDPYKYIKVEGRLK
jgi:hypothetical protein